MEDQPGQVGFAPRETQDTARAALAAALARLRRQRGLTGQELGRRAGMSQAKISKIETGVVAPGAGDVERLARALEAPDEVVDDLIDRANSLHDQFTDLRLTTQRLTSMQQNFARDEERATHISVFQIAVLPGLLQTTDYARAVLGEYATVLSGNEPSHQPQAAPAAVSGRIQRQEVLYDRRKRFDFVLAESVLDRMVGSPAQMLAQLESIRRVGAQENVRLTIVPADADLAFLPQHGFHLFDDRVVVIDLMSTTVVSRGREDIRVYRLLFDYFVGQATAEIDPILDRYMIRYADLARAAMQHGAADH